uniref:Secreted protein n=1 Tax=Ditylenchus dipsaci TaxID=166011 RepID=A0A915CS90_9BILA
MLSVQIFFIVYCALYSDAFSPVVGPRKWIRKLTYEEQQEIRQKCTPVSGVQERIIHGTLATEGQFKHTVVLTLIDASGVKRLNALEHYDQTSNYTLKVGGVCHSKGADGCDKIDMTVLPYDFALFDK